MSNNPEKQKLEPILKEVRPNNWQEILEKYERFSQAKRQELSAEIRLDEDQMEAVDGLVDDLTREGLGIDQKIAYVDTLEAMLDAQFGVTLDEAVERYETEKDKIFGTEAEKKPLSYGELVESYKKVEALLPTLQESESLSTDAAELLVAIKEQMVAIKTIELAQEIKKTFGNDYSAYLKVEEVTDEESGNTSLRVVKTDKFEELSVQEQARLDNKIIELSVKILLKQEKALLDVESRDYMRAFYQANQSLDAGDYKKAKDLYKKFLKHYEGAAGIKTESLEEPTVKRAIYAMKKIADLEIELVTGKLDSFSRSVKMIPRVSWNINKLGVSKDAAERMIEAQRKTLEAAKTLIKKNPSVLSLEDAITLIGGINEVQSQEPNGGTADEAYLINIGLCDSMHEAVQFLGDSNYGDWRSRGIAFYASKFGTDHKWGDKKFRMKDAKYVSQLDALGQFLETGGDEANMTREQLRQKAEYYQEVGLYDAAEQMYDKYFEGLYKYRTQRQSFEDYEAAFRKDPEKMEDIKEQIEKEQERLKEKEGRDMDEEQRDFLETYLIKEARKADIRANITETMKRSGDVDPKLAEEWDTYNDDYLQTDRHWYELWEVTNAEYDAFIETLPIDIVTLAVSGGLASAAGKKMTQFAARKLAAEEFMKMGVREAFKEGGRTAAMKVIASRLAGFAVESGVFSEMNMITYALRTGDTDALSSPKEHLKAWGHSAMVLGVLKAVNVPFEKLKGVPGAKAAIERVGGRILIDTVALSGMNVLTGMVSGDGQIAADIRNNIVLSVGVRAGQGLAAFGRSKFGGEGPKNPEGGGDKEAAKTDAEGKVDKEAKTETKGARETGTVAEKIDKGGEVEIDNNKAYNEAMDILAGEKYDMTLNERGELVGKKAGKPDVTLRESGKLAKESAKFKEIIEKALKDPTDANMRRVEKALERRNVPKEIIKWVNTLIFTLFLQGCDGGEMFSMVLDAILQGVVKAFVAVGIGITVGTAKAILLSGGGTAILGTWVARASAKAKRLSNAQNARRIKPKKATETDEFGVEREIDVIDTTALENVLNELKMNLRKARDKGNMEKVDTAIKRVNEVSEAAEAVNTAKENLTTAEGRNPAPKKAELDLLKAEVTAAEKALNKAITALKTGIDLINPEDSPWYNKAFRLQNLAGLGGLLRGGVDLGRGPAGAALGAAGRHKGKIFLLLLAAAALTGGLYVMRRINSSGIDPEPGQVGDVETVTWPAPESAPAPETGGSAPKSDGKQGQAPEGVQDGTTPSNFWPTGETTNEGSE